MLIGIERGWSEREEDEGDRIAGIRIFSLIGLLGGVSAQLSQVVANWFLGIAFLAVVAMIITAHVISIREVDDLGITTEFGMIITFALAGWAAFGFYVYAFATTAMVVGLLGLKPILHRGLRNIQTPETYAGIKLLIISVVLLPLLPQSGIRPLAALKSLLDLVDGGTDQRHFVCGLFCY